MNNLHADLLKIQQLLLKNIKTELGSEECSVHTMKLAAQVLKDNHIFLPPPKGDPSAILDTIDSAVAEIEYKDTETTDGEEFTPIEL